MPEEHVQSGHKRDAYTKLPAFSFETVHVVCDILPCFLCVEVCNLTSLLPSSWAQTAYRNAWYFSLQRSFQRWPIKTASFTGYRDVCSSRLCILKATYMLPWSKERWSILILLLCLPCSRLLSFQCYSITRYFCGTDQFHVRVDDLLALSLAAHLVWIVWCLFMVTSTSQAHREEGGSDRNVC